MFYVPCPNQETARSIALQLLKSKKIACANIINQMESLYLWHGKIEEASECILILKTSLETHKITQFQKTVQMLHPYEIPCIAEIDLGSVHSAYSSWISSEL